MAITKKQQQLDVMKWKKSEELGADACGTFDFCEMCDKTLENPCDKAYHKYHAGKKVEKTASVGTDEAKKPARKSCAKKTK